MEDFWPLIALILMSVEVGCYLQRSGEPKTGEYSFFVSFFGLILYTAPFIAGGFFDPLFK